MASVPAIPAPLPQIYIRFAWLSPIARGLYPLRLAQPDCPGLYALRLAQCPRSKYASLGPAPLGALEAMQAASLPCERLSGADVNEALACLSPDFVAGTATELAYPGTDRSHARCFPNNVDR